jgi:hypothetical protein
MTGPVIINGRSKRNSSVGRAFKDRRSLQYQQASSATVNNASVSAFKSDRCSWYQWKEAGRCSNQMG